MLGWRLQVLRKAISTCFCFCFFDFCHLFYSPICFLECIRSLKFSQYLTLVLEQNRCSLNFCWVFRLFASHSAPFTVLGSEDRERSIWPYFGELSLARTPTHSSCTRLVNSGAPRDTQFPESFLFSVRQSCGFTSGMCVDNSKIYIASPHFFPELRINKFSLVLAIFSVLNLTFPKQLNLSAKTSSDRLPLSQLMATPSFQLYPCSHISYLFHQQNQSLKRIWSLTTSYYSLDITPVLASGTSCLGYCSSFPTGLSTSVVVLPSWEGTQSDPVKR